MTYEYECESCGENFDVIKSVKDMEVTETCPKCGEFARRLFVPQHVFFCGTKVEHAEYNPGLGQVVRNSSHRKELAKRMGLEEVGNEDVRKIAKRAEKEREERREKEWDKAFEEAKQLALSPSALKAEGGTGGGSTV